MPAGQSEKSQEGDQPDGCQEACVHSREPREEVDLLETESVSLRLCWVQVRFVAELGRLQRAGHSDQEGLWHAGGVEQGLAVPFRLEDCSRERSAIQPHRALRNEGAACREGSGRHPAGESAHPALRPLSLT
jgi:hypothetical protein